MHVEDRSHPRLEVLEALKLSNCGWQIDKGEAAKVQNTSPDRFHVFLSAMEKNQSIHEGDRSHPQRVILDSLRFTYNGWKADMAQAEDYNLFWPILFDTKVSEMKRKQRVLVCVTKGWTLSKSKDCIPSNSSGNKPRHEWDKIIPDNENGTCTPDKVMALCIV